MRSIMVRSAVLAVLASWGCAADVTTGQGSAALSGEPDVYRCYPHDPESSVCAGNGITFFSADLRFHGCAKTRAGTSCWVDPESAPDLPLEFFSEAETAVIDCPDGTWLTCTDDDSGNIHCWCELLPSGGGGGGGGGVPTDELSLNFEEIKTTTTGTECVSGQ